MGGGWLHQLGTLLLDRQVQRGQPTTYRRILLENMGGGWLHQHHHQLGSLLLDCQVQRGQPTTYRRILLENMPGGWFTSISTSWGLFCLTAR
jgi:hypothetical protein